MILTQQQLQEFTEAAKPLVKFLNDNCNPHVTVIVNCSSAEILSASAIVKITEYIKD